MTVRLGAFRRVLARPRGAAALAALTLTEAADLAAAGRLDAPASGAVYGVILNTRSQLQALGDAIHAPPYRAPPQAPTLYIKPPNTLLHSGGDVPIPASLDAVEVNGTLAAVIGRTTTRASEDRALDHVLGYCCAIDICEPHANLHRPPVRQRSRDGFLPLGPWITTHHPDFDPDQQTVTVRVNSEVVSLWSTTELVRPLATLIADITAFMTLEEGDVLLAGLPAPGPRAKAGDCVEVEIKSLGRLSCTLVPERHA